MNEVFPEEETNFVNQDLGDATSFSAILKPSLMNLLANLFRPLIYGQLILIINIIKHNTSMMLMRGIIKSLKQEKILLCLKILSYRLHKFSILATRYKTNYPINSRVIFINDYINLYIEGVDIRGSINLIS